MVLFPDKRLSIYFIYFYTFYAAFSSFSWTRRSVYFSFFYFSYSFSDLLFFGNEARYQQYPYDLRSQISLCILPQNAPYDCCYFHIARFSGDIYRTKVDNTTVSYIFTSATGDRVAILRDRLSQANFEPFAEQRQYLHSSVILRL